MSLAAFFEEQRRKMEACPHESKCGIWPRGKGAPFYVCNDCGKPLRELTAEEIKKATSP